MAPRKNVTMEAALFAQVDVAMARTTRQKTLPELATYFAKSSKHTVDSLTAALKAHMPKKEYEALILRLGAKPSKAELAFQVANRLHPELNPATSDGGSGFMLPMDTPAPAGSSGGSGGFVLPMDTPAPAAAAANASPVERALSAQGINLPAGKLANEVVRGLLKDARPDQLIEAAVYGMPDGVDKNARRLKLGEDIENLADRLANVVVSNRVA